ncbi:hypothetical protein [Armatimonas sp.]|uniref:hypothetical protein n=1 Tax=Armatimonas sp. TaxID=1872638 RepID=UPI00374D4DF9
MSNEKIVGISSSDELTCPQAAVLAGCTRGAVNNAIRAGKLSARREDTPRGPMLWVKRSDVLKWSKPSAEPQRGRPRVGTSPRKGSPKKTTTGAETTTLEAGIPA